MITRRRLQRIREVHDYEMDGYRATIEAQGRMIEEQNEQTEALIAQEVYDRNRWRQEVELWKRRTAENSDIIDTLRGKLDEAERTIEGMKYAERIVGQALSAAQLERDKLRGEVEKRRSTRTGHPIIPNVEEAGGEVHARASLESYRIIYDGGGNAVQVYTWVDEDDGFTWTRNVPVR